MVLASLSHRASDGTLYVEDHMAVRVLIVDDQEPFRMAARMVVEATRGFGGGGGAGTGGAAGAAARG